MGGLTPGAVDAYLSPDEMLFFFPLGHPAPWRLLGMRPGMGPAMRPGSKSTGQRPRSEGARTT